MTTKTPVVAHISYNGDQVTINVHIDGREYSFAFDQRNMGIFETNESKNKKREKPRN